MRPIDQVLTDLDDIIAETVADNNFLGVFAYVYRRTTAEIKKAIDEGRFENGERLERMDVVFAKRYIDAYQAWKANEPHTEAWAESFQARSEPITILQHLFLGMNAHINLDLGIATAEVAPAGEVELLKDDFMLVNTILGELTNVMQQKIGRVSPLFFIADWVGGNKDEAFADLSIEKARGFAWGVATQLEPLQGPLLDEAINLIDKQVALIARVIKRPPGRLLPWILRLVQKWETKDVNRIIQRLKE